MRRKLMIAVAVCCVCFAGCNRKTIKTQAPEVQAAPVAEQVGGADEAPVFNPSDEETFTAVDMDAAMKKVFVTVYFDFDQYDLREETVERVKRVGAFMMDNARVRVLIEGHCDELGSAEYNIGLGEKRARAVQEYLVSYGINKNRLEITSYGKERLARANCQDQECHGLNRRVEWKILAK